MKSLLFLFISISFLIFLFFYVSPSKKISEKSIVWKLNFDEIQYTSLLFPNKNFSIQKIKYSWRNSPLFVLKSKNENLSYLANYQIKNFVQELSNLEIQSIIKKNSENLKKINYKSLKWIKIELLKKKLKKKEFFFSENNPIFLVDENYILKVHPYLLSRIDEKIWNLRQKKIIQMETKKIHFFSFISNEKRFQIQKFDSSKKESHRKIESTILDLEVDFFPDEIQFYKKSKNIKNKIVLKFDHYPKIKISIFEAIEWNKKKLVPFQKEIDSVFRESIVYIEKEKYIQFKNRLESLNP